MNDLKLAELMSPGVWHALISAAWFAITGGVSEIHLRQLLLGILSTYSEREESGGLPASTISPHDARSILADCGEFKENLLLLTLMNSHQYRTNPCPLTRKLPRRLARL